MKLPPLATLITALILMAACATAPGGELPSNPATTSPAPPSASATAIPTPTAAPTATPAPTTSLSPTVTPSAIPTEYDQEPPPIGAILLGDGTLVEGRPGSWCYEMGCADVPWLPARVLPRIDLAKAATELMFSLPEPHRFVYWLASYSEADDPFDQAVRLGFGGEYDTDQTPATPIPELREAVFTGPRSGSWTLRVFVLFPGYGGDASYYWHAVVP